jgi:hypothetical protein
VKSVRISPDPPQTCGTSNKCGAEDRSSNGCGPKDRAGCRYSSVLKCVVVQQPVWRDGLTQGCTDPGQLHFVWWHHLFMVPEYGTCSMLPLWHLKVLRCLLDSW